MTKKQFKQLQKGKNYPCFYIELGNKEVNLFISDDFTPDVNFYNLSIKAKFRAFLLGDIGIKVGRFASYDKATHFIKKHKDKDTCVFFYPHIKVKEGHEYKVYDDMKGVESEMFYEVL